MQEVHGKRLSYRKNIKMRDVELFASVFLKKKWGENNTIQEHEKFIDLFVTFIIIFFKNVYSNSKLS